MLAPSLYPRYAIIKGTHCGARKILQLQLSVKVTACMAFQICDFYFVELAMLASNNVSTACFTGRDLGAII